MTKRDTRSRVSPQTTINTIQTIIEQKPNHPLLKYLSTSNPHKSTREKFAATASINSSLHSFSPYLSAQRRSIVPLPISSTAFFSPIHQKQQPTLAELSQSKFARAIFEGLENYKMGNNPEYLIKSLRYILDNHQKLNLYKPIQKSGSKEKFTMDPRVVNATQCLVNAIQRQATNSYGLLQQAGERKKLISLT